MSAPRRKGDKSGAHSSPRRPLSAPQVAWELWGMACAQAGGVSWAVWARETLTAEAARQLGIDPEEALREVGE